jgi:hypothetical protein
VIAVAEHFRVGAKLFIKATGANTDHRCA